MKDPALQVLLVEDQPEYAHLVQTIISKAGDGHYNTLLAGSLRDAVAHLKKRAFDVVILDLLLPDSRGVVTVEAIRAAAPKVPILVTTAIDEEETLFEALSRGAQDYLIKGPSLSTLLIRAMQHAMEKKKAEEELKAREAQYKELADLLPEVVCEVNIEGRILFANRNAFDRFGYSPDDLSKGLTVFQMLSPEQIPTAQSNIREVLEGKPSRHVEYTAQRKDGSTFPIRVYATRILQDGKPVGFRAILVDITEEKRLQQQREEERRLLFALVDSVPDSIYIKDRDGRYMLINRHKAERSGLQHPREAIGKTDFDFFPEEHARAAYRDEQEVMGTGEPIVAKDERIVRRDGSVTWSSTTKVPRYDEHGDIIGTCGISRDITALKDAEAALEESEDRYRSIFEQAGESIVIIEPDSGKIIDFNDRAAVNLNYTRDEFQNISLTDIEIDESGNDIKRHLANIIRNGGDVFETRHRTKHGRIRDIEVNVRVVTIHGQKYVQAIWRDVTEQKRLQQQLLQAQKMQVVGRLAGGVAHDFNNLLTIINGYTELAKEELHKSDIVYSYVDEIEKAGRRGEGITKQLLTFSRRHKSMPHIVDLNALIHDMQNMLKRVIPENIDLRFTAADDPLTARVDAGYVEQAILNLVLNARDAIEGRGTIAIHTSSIHTKTSLQTRFEHIEPGDYVLITVNDTGSGMDEDVLEHIFEPFFSTKAKEKGTGLGLSTVYGIVKQSHGYIDVKSRPGRGSTFHVYFPACKEQASPVVHRDGRGALPAGDETILVVEDEESVRMFTKRILTRQGYKVLEAVDGKEALEIVRNHKDPIHLILTDVIMPRMNGQELSEAVNASFPDVRIVFMSGYSETEWRKDPSVEFDFLQKPVKMRDLVHKIRAVLDRE